jgi:GT2 family glycosyltransferase
MGQAMRAPKAPAIHPQTPVAVIIIAWNSGDVLQEAIASALAQNPMEVVVVDNHSTDHSIVPLRRLFPQIQIISLASNTGFAAACNIGIASTQAPYLLFLNDDAIVAPDYAQTLIASMGKNPKAASAVGKLVYVQAGQTRIDSAGLRLDRWALRPSDRGQGEIDVGQYNTPQAIFGPTGAAAIYARSALQAAGEGGFDASLFAYYEDVDLAWRLSNLGYVHLYQPQAIAHHARRGPRGKPLAIVQRAFVNRYTVWVKNDAWYLFALWAPLALAWEAARLARMMARDPMGTCAIVRAVPSALWRGWRARRRRP